MEIRAEVDTWLTKTDEQASSLPSDQKVEVPAGKTYPIKRGPIVLSENEDEDTGTSSGKIKINIQHGAGEWYIFGEHWRLPWQIIAEEPKAQPEWDEVDWNFWNAPVSKYFTVGEVTNMSLERIPTDPTIKRNIVNMARQMDEVREWWGGPLGVTSWYRPWAVNRRIGSSAPNHPGGYAVDFRPLNGSVWELQKRFQEEWYDTGRWDGGLGLGARRGFMHLDLRNRRVWNY